jgi:serine/threonine protein kinase
MIRLLFDMIKGKNLKAFILSDSLKNLQPIEKMKVLLEIFKQIVEGIQFIHKFGIIHSDIKH